MPSPATTSLPAFDQNCSIPIFATAVVLASATQGIGPADRRWLQQISQHASCFVEAWHGRRLPLLVSLH